MMDKFFLNYHRYKEGRIIFQNEVYRSNSLESVLNFVYDTTPDISSAPIKIYRVRDDSIAGYVAYRTEGSLKIGPLEGEEEWYPIKVV